METGLDDFQEPRVCTLVDSTILDVLNADCWRLILDHLSVNDIMRSERVSRAWQRVVLEYLAGVHNYRIEDSYFFYKKLPERYWNYRSINLHRQVRVFEEMIQKIGPFIVKIVAYCDESRLRAIALRCPNLEALTFYRSFLNLPRFNVEKCKQLKRIVFDRCALREDYLNEMITSEALEELVIISGRYVTGRFLKSLKKNLKSLALNSCDFLLFKHIQAAVDYLIKLTRLELNENSSQTLQNVHLLLDRMPDLEHLSLMEYGPTELGSELPAAIGRLSRLRELQLWRNENVTDEWLTAAARGCPALRSVNVGGCHGVTPRGLLALCQARPTLLELLVAYLDVTDADLEAYTRCCGGLELLDAYGCHELTSRLPERLARPRARPLLLRLDCDKCSMKVKKAHYEGLKLRWNETTLYESATASYSDDSDYNQNYDDSSDSDHSWDTFKIRDPFIWPTRMRK